MYLSALLLCSGDLRTDLEILIPIKFLDLPQDESTVLQIVADYGCSAKIAARTAMRSHNYKSSSDGGSGPRLSEFVNLPPTPQIPNLRQCKRSSCSGSIQKSLKMRCLILSTDSSAFIMPNFTQEAHLDRETVRSTPMALVE